MKKSRTNPIALFSCAAVVVIALLSVSILMASPASSNAKEDSPSSSSTITVQPEQTSSSNPVPQASSQGAMLFIGDSRTVGLMEYSQLEEADFFADTGMTVFNIHEKIISVPTEGRLTLSELLDDKQYGSVYIMLGVNELGYQFDSIIDEYEKLVEFIQEKQPNSQIILQGNLHVTQERSNTDDYINNGMINTLNARIEKMAEDNGLFYLDANAIFDDETGALSEEKSDDSTHPLGKYYGEWGQWILDQAESCAREG